MTTRPRRYPVVLPPAQPLDSPLEPAFTSSQVQQLTGLTSSQLISLSRLGELGAELAQPRGRGHRLAYSIINVWQLAVLQRLLQGGLRLREALTVRHRLDVAVVHRDDARWLDRQVLILDYGPDPARVARGPYALWRPDSLAWLAAERAWLAVVRAQHLHGPRQAPQDLIVSPTLPVQALAGQRRLALALLISFEELWHALGYLTPTSPDADTPRRRAQATREGR